MTGQRIMFDMRMQIYEHLQRLDLRFYDRNPVGRLMTRVTTDVDVINDLFTSGVVSVFGDVFTLAGIMIVMLSMNWRLALVDVRGAAADRSSITQWFRRNVRESYRTVRMLIARINAYLQEHITGMSTVQLFRREARAFARFDAINEEHRDANVDSIFYYAVFYPAIEIVGALAVGADDLVRRRLGAARRADARLAGGLPALLAALLPADLRHVGEVQHPAGRDGLLRAHLQAARRAGEDQSPPPQATAEPRVGRAPKHGARRRPHRLRPRLVRLQPHGDGEERLRPARRVVRGPARRARRHRRRDRRRQVHADQPAAAVLRRLTRPDPRRRRGRPRDGSARSARRSSASCCRTCICSPARSPTTSGSGQSSIDDEARPPRGGGRARDSFIERLPRGYAAPVAERGATLSVGQKQLLSFARALAFDPRILVLDEATSSVDTETEILIRDALQVLMAGRTTIAIAHRLSTIQDMDKILVLHKGQLREAGTHQELLAKRGIYFKLYQLQYKDQESAGPRRTSTKCRLTGSRLHASLDHLIGRERISGGGRRLAGRDASARGTGARSGSASSRADSSPDAGP